MSETTSVPDDDLELRSAASLLAALAQFNGRHVTLVEAQQAWLEAERLEDRAGGLPEDWERLRTAGRLLGLSLVPVDLDLEQVLAAGRGCLVTQAAGTRVWVALHHDRGRLARWVYPRGFEPTTLRGARKLLGGREQRTWLIVDASLPVTGGHDDGAGPLTAAAHSGPGDHHDHHRHLGPMRRLWRLLRLETRDMVTVVIFSLAVGVLSLGTPLAVEALVNSVAFGGLMQPLVVLTVLLASALLLGGALRALQTYLVEVIQRRLFVRLAIELAYRLPRVAWSQFGATNGPELVNRFFDVMTVQKASATLLLDGVSVVLGALIGMLVLAFYHPVLLGFDILLLALIGAMVFVLGRGAVATSIQESRVKYAVAAWLEEMARLPLSFKQGAAPEFALLETDRLAREYLMARQSHFRVLFRQILFAFGIQVVASSALLGAGGWLVVDGQLTLGQLVAAELIVAVVVGSLLKLGKHLESYYDLAAAVDKVGHLLDLPMESERGELIAGRGARGAALSMSGVRLPGLPGQTRDFDLDVQPGERVALLGPFGWPQTAVLQAIFGLTTPAQGRIEFDGVDLRDIRLESLRKQVALAAGHEVLDRSLLENVRFTVPPALGEEVRNVLQDVGLLELARELPEGLRTRLALDGSPLPHSAVNLVVLARAMLAQPRLLLVDGLLDALDEAAQARVLKALCDRGAPWTLLLATHDPQVARSCDRTIDLTMMTEER